MLAIVIVVWSRYLIVGAKPWGSSMKDAGHLCLLASFFQVLGQCFAYTVRVWVKHTFFKQPVTPEAMSRRPR